MNNSFIRLGQVGYLFKLNNVNIIIDPVLSDLTDINGNTRRNYPPICSGKDLKVDYYLITHSHADHLCLDTIKDIYSSNPDCTFILPKGIVNNLKDLNLNKVIGINEDDELIFNEIKIKGIQTAHPTHHKDENNNDTNLAYLISNKNINLVHLGDTYLTDKLVNKLSKIDEINYLFAPINGIDSERESRGIIGNLNEDEAINLFIKLKTNYLIPTHYDMVKGNCVDINKFIELSKKYKISNKTIILNLGEEYLIK